MTSISDSVGRGGKNARNDVITIQQLLENQRGWLNGLPPPPVTGTINPQTMEAITAFQKNAVAFLTPPGVIAPNDVTMRKLSQAVIAPLRHKIFAPSYWGHSGGPLTLADYTGAAQQLKCEVAAIQAVGETENPGKIWDSEGRPRILFERHVFTRNSGGMFDLTHSDISNPAPGGYGKDSEQYKKLNRAALLNETAALCAASWSRFQILGESHVFAGFDNVETLVDAMMLSEQNQLKAFVSFVSNKHGTLQALQSLNWVHFAKMYNGSQALTNYDKDGLNYPQRMERNYRAIKSQR